MKRSDFPAILEHAIAQVRRLVEKKGLLTVTADTVRARVRNEDHESPDNRSRPLENRLIRIFDIDTSAGTDELMSEMCRYFMRPIFARGQCYHDTFPVLRELRARSFKTAIVSNTSWGSPAFLWRDEVEKIGLIELMDDLVFDRDVGWRKPARQIFESALEKLRVRPDECLFVGDEPRWDIEGSKAVGIDAILVDRLRNTPIAEERTVKNLSDLLAILSRQ